MAQIHVEFDSKIEHRPIKVPITGTSEEMQQPWASRGNNFAIKQTRVYGICSPLAQVNDIMIAESDIVEFELKSKDILPTVSMTIVDNYGLISKMDTPDRDNIMSVQIIPDFDIYRKINLSFYVTTVRATGRTVTLNGVYNLAPLTDSRYESMGKLCTYELFEKIAMDTGLGFATNVKKNTSDSRYIYCDNKSYMDIISREVGFAGYDNAVFDTWIDFWDNLNLVDINERYNSKDSDEDMMIWISGIRDDASDDTIVEPVKVQAIIHNNPLHENSDLFVKRYTVINRNRSNMTRGTDNVLSVYSDGNREYSDFLMQNSDVQDNIFKKYEYAGEVYGDINYLLNRQKRSLLMSKIEGECVEVQLCKPVFGLMRGHKVNFISYINDSLISSKAEALKIHNLSSPIESDIRTPDMPTDPDKGSFEPDKVISGQYLITRSIIRYSKSGWTHILHLSRPWKNKPKLINDIQ